MIMPNFDAKGPRGQSSGTGWGRGPCGAGLRRGSARSRGQRFHGRGRGQPVITSLGGPPRWGYGPWGFGISVSSKKTGYVSPKDEAEALRELAAYLQSELEAIQRRLAEMEHS
ncbi:MAG: hypothetical protein C4567_11845 [Deltaproteobacteria bacterium]|nr:MAG: hypothetical protein C4567_11845 [Deltaproteobacteria bacterium]